MSAKTRPRDYGKAQRCAAALYTARQRLKSIAAAAKRGAKGTDGAADIEHKREGDALALLTAQAVNLDAQFLRDVGDALEVLLLNGEDAFRSAPDEGRFVLRCAANSYCRQFKRRPTHREFCDFLIVDSGDKSWPEFMRLRAEKLAGLSQKRLQKLLPSLRFAPSKQKRGETNKPLLSRLWTDS